MNNHLLYSTGQHLLQNPGKLIYCFFSQYLPTLLLIHQVFLEKILQQCNERIGKAQSASLYSVTVRDMVEDSMGNLTWNSVLKLFDQTYKMGH